MPGYHRQMLICMACAAFLCLLVFAFLAWQLRLGGLAAFDGTVTGWVRSFVNPGLTSWMILITDLGIFGFVTALTALATILLFVRRQWMDGLGVTAAPLTAWWLELYLKSIFQRPRPGLPQLDAAPGYSFPSGHAIVTAALLFTLALVYYRHTNSRTGRMLALTVASLLVLLVGISRVYLGVHYPSDVVAGWALGGLLVVVIAFLIHLGSRKSQGRGL